MLPPVSAQCCHTTSRHQGHTTCQGQCPVAAMALLLASCYELCPASQHTATLDRHATLLLLLLPLLMLLLLMLLLQLLLRKSGKQHLSVWECLRPE